MIAKNRIFVRLFQTCWLQFSGFDEVLQIVRIARIHTSLVWEVVTLRCPRDARLQSAFDCVTSKIIRAVEKARVQ